MPGPPGTITERGYCPSCEAAGEVGAACVTAQCAKYGYHHIPEDAFEKRVGKDGLPDKLLGLEFGGYLVMGAQGEGGIGRVYRARQRSTGMRVALKVLLARSQAIFQERFEREARALANLAHPNIVGLRDFGSEHGRSYMVMEFVEGATLKEFLKTRPPLADLAPIFEQLLSALAYAHQREIVHRDIKPDNVMLQPVGDGYFVRLLDFGLAKDVVDSDVTSIVGGTPAYMAPEQMRGVKIGPWTDLFAVGCMAYDALIGRRPYEGLSPLLRDRCKFDKADYNPAAHLAETEPEPIARFLRDALAHDPALRIQDTQTFAEAMRRAFAARLAGDAPVAPAWQPGEGRQASWPSLPAGPAEPSTPSLERSMTPGEPAASSGASVLASAEPSDPAPPPPTGGEAQDGRGLIWALVGAAALLIAVVIWAVAREGDAPKDSVASTGSKTPISVTILPASAAPPSAAPASAAPPSAAPPSAAPVSVASEAPTSAAPPSAAPPVRVASEPRRPVTRPVKRPPTPKTVVSAAPATRPPPVAAAPKSAAKPAAPPSQSPPTRSFFAPRPKDLKN